MEQKEIIKAQQLEGRIKELHENLEFIDSQVLELEQFSNSISEFGKSKSKEIIASLGKGVHIPAEITSKSLFVEVGSGVVVKKSPEETLEVVSSQLTRIKEARLNLLSEIDSTRTEFFSIIEGLESSQKE